ncbi:MAG: hypothetical protein A2W25_03505 [candidate division Zixibacteria bacterium RBG_16_53_22]|nr:MAG: hypothetical protein A2W25_03505 [candidate division Zixibacteria bacterium RBG_16_53_22]
MRNVILRLTIGLALLLWVSPMAQDIGRDLKTPEPKNPSTALALSVGATIIPIATGLARIENDDGTWLIAIPGVFVGPAVGYFYGGCTGRGMQGILTRTAIGALGLIVASQAANGRSGMESIGAGVAVIGAFSVIIGVDAIYDIAVVQKTVKEQNRRKTLSLSLIPNFFPESDGYGLMISMAF